MIQYQKILSKNMLNVFKDILKHIQNNSLSNNNHLYITFLTNHKNVKLPNWIKSEVTDQNKYYGSIPSDLASTPYGTNLLKETPFYKILERTSETPVNIGEELVKPWRQPQILLSNVDDLSSAIDNVGRDEHLSLGVYENPDLSKELNYKYFAQLTIASNTTVATFNGPCTWTMPYYPAEFFNHAMKRLNSDNVLVTMSPREQIVPNGVPVTGFSQTYLKNSQFLLNQNKNNHLHHTFSDCWEKDCGMDDNRKLIFKGHVSEVKALLNTAIQVNYRPERGAAVAGWLPDYADQNKVHIDLGKMDYIYQPNENDNCFMLYEDWRQIDGNKTYLYIIDLDNPSVKLNNISDGIIRFQENHMIKYRIINNSKRKLTE